VDSSSTTGTLWPSKRRDADLRPWRISGSEVDTMRSLATPWRMRGWPVSGSISMSWATRAARSSAAFFGSCLPSTASSSLLAASPCGRTPGALGVNTSEHHYLWGKLRWCHSPGSTSRSRALGGNGRPISARSPRRRLESPSGRRWPMRPLKERTWRLRHARYVDQEGKAGLLTACEPSGDGASVVVRGRESRPHCEGRQVFRPPRG
jgi:hypothetical protein